MGPLTTDGLGALHAPGPSALMEIAVGPGAPQVAIRTGAALAVAVAPRPTATAAAALRGLPPSLVGAGPPVPRLAAAAVVLPAPPALGRLPSEGRVAYVGVAPSNTASVGEAPIKAVRRVAIATGGAPVRHAPPTP